MRSGLIMTIALAMLVGCRSHANGDPTPRRPKQDSVQREARTLDDYIANVQGAQNAQQEADALRALRRHEIANGLTYQVAAFDTATNVRIASPSTHGGPLRVQLTIFRRRDTVSTFNFVPHDNRNLALLGE
jgi:hypothetical protein